MAIYSKGSRPYRGPYSPDFTESKVTGLDRDSYDPPLTAAEVRAGKIAVKNWDGQGIDCSSTIDPQTSYGFGFDDAKGRAGNWSTARLLAPPASEIASCAPCDGRHRKRPQGGTEDLGPTRYSVSMRLNKS